MAPWAAPAAAASILLIATGATKAVRPEGSAVVFPLSVSPRMSGTLARLLGVAEIAIGLGVLIVGNRLALGLMAALFTGFAVFAFVALRSGASSCGCTGAPDTPPTSAHIVMNIAFALLAGLAVAADQPSSAEVVVRAATDAVGVAVVLMTVTVAWLAWMVLGLGALRTQRVIREGRTT